MVSLLLKHFANLIRSVENILLLDDIKKFKTSTDPQERLRLAKTIYDTYLSDNSLLQVNVTRSSCAAIGEILNTKSKPEDLQLGDEIFNEIYKEVKITLSDTYHRFSKIPENRAMIRQSQKVHKMLSEKADDPGLVDYAIDTLKRKSRDLRRSLKLQFGDRKPSFERMSEVSRTSSPIVTADSK